MGAPGQIRTDTERFLRPLPLPLGYGGGRSVFQSQRRGYGLEVRQHFPLIAALGTPEASVVAGIARAQDEPVEGKWRFYLSLALRP